MAISAYGKALASMAKESVLGSVQGFGSSVKSAAMSEMPALTGAIAFARSLRKEAEKYQKETEKSNDEIKDEVKKQVKETRVGNVIGIESAKLLKSINANTTIQTRLMLQQAKFERQSRMFAEEESRERLLEQKKLLDAIRKIGMARGGLALSSSGDSGGGGGLFSMLGDLLGLGLKGAAGVGGALLGARGGKYLLDKFKGPKQEVLGSSKRNPLLSGRASNAVNARMVGGFLPRILGGFLSGPVGWALLAATVYQILDSIFDFNIFSSARASTALPGPTGSTSNIGGARSRSQNRSQGRGVKAPLSVRNNNPGNLRFVNQPGATRGEGGFAKFNSPEEGIEALRRQVYLDTQSRGLTLSQFIAKYAPPNENNTSRYVTYVSQQTGLKPNEIVPENMIPAVMQAIVKMEGGQAAYSYFYNQPTQTASRAGKTGPKFTAPFMGPKINRTELLGRRIGSTSISSISGSGTLAPQQFIIPTRDEALIAIASDQTKILGNIGKSSGTVAKIETQRVAEQLRRTRRVETPEQRILRTANEAFLRGFQDVTTRKITAAVEKALFPKGYGVTAAQASGELYRGRTAADLLGTQKFFNRTFGKDYGPLFNQLSQSYLEVGARAAGNFLFGGTAGVDSQVLTGQILGNIKQGRKDVALEQLLYGMTGTASGFETLFAKYGFGSAKEGVGAIGNVLGAGATDIVRNNFPFIGEVPGQTMYRDPITGKPMPYGGLGDITKIPFQGKNALAVINVDNVRPGVSASAAASGAGRSVTYGNASQIYGYGYGEDLVQATVETNTTLNNQHNEQLSYLEKVHDDDKAWTENSDKIRRENAAAGVGATMAAAASTGNVFTRGIEWLGSIFTSSAGRGGGTNLNIGFGGGGQPTFGNFLMDLGKTAVVSKLTSGIKDPYARQIASFGLNRAADVGIQTLMSGGNLSTFGANLATSFFGPNTALTSAYGATLGQQIGAQALGAVGLAGTAAAYSAMVPGLTAGSAQAAMLASQTGVFGSAGLSATAAAGSTATAGTAAAGSTLGGQLAALASNPITWIVLGAILLFGSKKKAPTAVHKVIAITGNSNIDAKAVVFTRHNPPKAYYDAADQFLNVAFNTTKMLEIRTGKRAPFDYIYMRLKVIE
jgi:hypothetical protein